MDIPILSLLVTFLHEFGHAAAALISGGHVLSLQVNLDGSGLTTTRGGNAALIDCGGYIGSIIFGNIMLYFGIRHKYGSRILAALLAICMVIVSLVWFSTITSFIFTAIMGAVLFFLFAKLEWSGRAFMIIAGAYSMMYIIKDYRIGPSSDLEAFSQVVGLTPSIWMCVWLTSALVITIITLCLSIRTVLAK